MMDTRRLYLDCDGVLADFDTAALKLLGMTGEQYEEKFGTGAFWDKLREYNFFECLPLMPDARELVEGLKHLRPIILTGCPRGSWAQPQKLAWALKHFPAIPMITCRSRNKADHCQVGDILVDDITKYQHIWEAAGGKYIVHKSAKQSIEEVNAFVKNRYRFENSCDPR